jgi:hypothetical protein
MAPFQMALSTTTILARSMPFGAPSTPSAKGRIDPLAKLSANVCFLRILLKNSNFRFDHNSEDRWRP